MKKKKKRNSFWSEPASTQPEAEESVGTSEPAEGENIPTSHKAVSAQTKMTDHNGASVRFAARFSDDGEWDVQFSCKVLIVYIK